MDDYQTYVPTTSVQEMGEHLFSDIYSLVEMLVSDIDANDGDCTVMAMRETTYELRHLFMETLVEVLK